MKKTPPYKEAFQGIYAAALTPLHEDLSCDHEAHAAHCKHLIEEGCSGVVPFGTTGEGPSFNVAERRQGIQALIERGIDPQKIIVSVGCPSIEDTVELTKASLHCAAVLMMPPYFFKNITDAGVIAFYREVIRRVNDPRLKIFLYHFPMLSGVPISLEVIRVLRAEFPSLIVGIKESEGNVKFIGDILQEFPGFRVFPGKETLLAAAVKLGAAGGINGVANLCPQLLCDLYQSNARQSEIEQISALFQGVPFIPACKILLEKKTGYPWNRLRPPLVSLREEQSRRLLADSAGLKAL